MTGITETQDLRTGNDLALGIEGFNYSDLFDSVKLKELAEAFYAEVEQKEPVLHSALTKYIAARGHGFERKVESKILTDAAPYLSDFIGRLFHISRERGELDREIESQNPVWKFKFFCAAAGVEKVQAGAAG